MLLETKDFLCNYISEATNDLKRFHYLPIDIEKDMKKTITQKNYTLFRGMSWGVKEIDNIKIWFNDVMYGKLYKVGDIMTLTIPDISSWSVSKEIGNSFSHSADYHMFGITLKLNVDSSNILVDMSELNKIEQEVLLKPGIYKCQIVNLIYYKTQINSMDQWSDFMTPEFDSYYTSDSDNYTSDSHNSYNGNNRNINKKIKF